MYKTAYIGLGSNIGERRSNCLRAMELMNKMPACSITGRSSFYRTEPQGIREQEWFVNAVCSLEVSCTPKQLLGQLLSIEKEMGRLRKEKWGPRLIDLDILIFGENAFQEEDLVIPHPLMHLRRFVLVPLAEIAPDLIHPVFKKSILELRDLLAGEGQRVLKMER